MRVNQKPVWDLGSGQGGRVRRKPFKALTEPILRPPNLLGTQQASVTPSKWGLERISTLVTQFPRKGPAGPDGRSHSATSPPGDVVHLGCPAGPRAVTRRQLPKSCCPGVWKRLGPHWLVVDSWGIIKSGRKSTGTFSPVFSVSEPEVSIGLALIRQRDLDGLLPATKDKGAVRVRSRPTCCLERTCCAREG